MRPFVFFFTFFSLFSAAALVAAEYTEIITNQDPRIAYAGDNWRNISFPGGTFSYVRQGRGAAKLTVFNASKIAVTAMVETPGQTVGISLDNEVNVATPSNPQEPAWTSGNLDPNVPHTIEVAKINPIGQYTSLYSFVVTHPGSSPDTTGTAPPVSSQSTSSPDNPGMVNASSTPDSSESSSPQPTSSAISTQQSNTEPVLSGAKLAGVIVGCISALVLIVGFILYRRRMVSKRTAASTAYWEYIMARAQQQQPTPPDERFDGAETKELP